MSKQTKRASAALRALKAADTAADRLAAAQALESAACQLRRALKQETTEQQQERWIVQAWNGKRWAKVRGSEGGPWPLKSRAQRIATLRQQAERGASSTEGMPHRVVQS